MPYSAHPYILSDYKNWINLILWQLHITSHRASSINAPCPMERYSSPH